MVEGDSMPRYSGMQKIEHTQEEKESITGIITLLKMSQREFAKMAGVSQGYVSMILQGKTITTGRELAAVYAGLDIAIEKGYNAGIMSNEDANRWHDYVNELRSKAHMPEIRVDISPDARTLGFMEKYVDWNQIFNTQYQQIEGLYQGLPADAKVRILADLERIVNGYQLPTRDNTQ